MRERKIKKRKNKIRKNRVVITAVMIAAATIVTTGICFYFIESQKGVKEIEREETGVSMELKATVGETEIPLELELEPQDFTEEQLEEAFVQAEREITENYLGENSSAEQVMHELNLMKQAANGRVKVKWASDSPVIQTSDGNILGEPPDEGLIILLTATLSCQNQERQMSFPVKVVPVMLSDTQMLQQGLQEELEAQEETQRDTDKLTLPEEYRGLTITWEKNTGSELMLLPVLVMVGGVTLCLRGKEAGRKKEMERQQLFLQIYPEIVSKTAILLNAGMPVSAVWELLAESRQSNPVYEEMRVTIREMRGGLSEPAAYERFAQRVGNRQYRKYISLLLQHMKKGTKQMDMLLEQEVNRALEYHRSEIIRKAEQAGTKLLLPMTLLLLIVMAILMVPAMSTITV